jgi:DNA polymerase IV
MATQRIIFHIDMNSYFASCEQQENPAWRGQPVGVCEHLGGIIIAASIEAKRWGIKIGTPVWEARKLYPKIILTPTHPDIYRKYTARFLKVFGDYTDDVEKYSIDEVFLDATKSCNIARPDGQGGRTPIDPWLEAERVAGEIKRRMKREVGDWLRCSVGIAGNKLLAKIGSNYQKPDGLTIFRPEDKAGLYQKLKLTDMPGIARRTERNLNALGINSLEALRDYPASKLVAQFGIMGYHLHKIGQLEGSWKEEIGGDDAEEPIKSMGHMYTIPIEFRKQPVLRQVLYKLSEMVGARLRVNGLMGSVVHVYLRNAEYNGSGGSRKLGYFLDDGRDIYLEAMATLLGQNADLGFWQENLYLIGVTVAGLAPHINQPSLFEFYEKKNRLVRALDQVNDKYEDFTLARVPAFLARDIIRDSIGFGRMKEFKTSHVRGRQSRFG